MSDADHGQRLNAHYGRSDLGAAIVAGLRAAGLDLDALGPADLAPVDQFHTRGREATLELATLAGLGSGQRVLDVGGGLGGPARTLAADRGCHVTVLDLTEEFCRVGTELTARLRLGDRVEFRRGNALDMPFEAAAFDVVWTQHSTMNIDDKERLYREIHRVLRPGGTLAMHEIMAGPGGPVHFPVPWARDPTISFLRPPAAVRSLLADLGFVERVWRDTTAPSTDWFRKRLAGVRQAPSPPPLGIHLLLGPDFGTMFANQVRNLEEGRIAVIEAVWGRAA